MIYQLTDGDGDTHVAHVNYSGQVVIRVECDMGDEENESGRIFASDALKLIDVSGANTTADKLRTRIASATSILESSTEAEGPAELADYIARALKVLGEP